MKKTYGSLACPLERKPHAFTALYRRESMGKKVLLKHPEEKDSAIMLVVKYSNDSSKYLEKNVLFIEREKFSCLFNGVIRTRKSLYEIALLFFERNISSKKFLAPVPDPNALNIGDVANVTAWIQCGAIHDSVRKRRNSRKKEAV